VADEVTAFYSKSSFGKISLTFEVLEKDKWVDMGRSAESYNLVQNKPQQNNEQVVVDALARVDASVNFDLYDGVVVESGRFQATGGGQGFPGQKFVTKNGVAKGVSLEFGTGVARTEVLAHELGHSLFGLEDLYVFLNANRPSVPDPTPAGNWDMMSTSAREYLAWNKLLMGWIEDSQIRCLKTQGSTTHYVEGIDVASNKPKVVLINLDDGVTLAIEARLAFSGSNNRGLLVYKIDSRIAHGDGPIIAQKSLIYPGNSLSIEGWSVKALDQDKNGLLLEVIRNS
jgi:M6 family metalloprotease-like protein